MSLILVVDDVAIHRLENASILKKYGHTVIEANDGTQAVSMALEHKPAAIIMDIVMKDMDGFSALKKLQKNPETKDIPVIMVSSKAQESDRFRAKQLGAKEYLNKPTDPDQLMDALKGLI